MPRITDDNYWEEAFQVWYASGQPKAAVKIREIIPNDEDGNKPTVTNINNAITVYGWHERADVLNTKAIEQNEMILVNQKADMLRRQAENALEIANKAKQYIVEGGFDSSASAVTAYFKATDEERTVRGVSDMLIRVSKYSPEELMERAAQLLRRKDSSEGEIIEDEDGSQD